MVRYVIHQIKGKCIYFELFHNLNNLKIQNVKWLKNGENEFMRVALVN
jgi:hypothetical protein